MVAQVRREIQHNVDYNREDFKAKENNNLQIIKNYRHPSDNAKKLSPETFRTKLCQRMQDC